MGQGLRSHFPLVRCTHSWMHPSLKPVRGDWETAERPKKGWRAGRALKPEAGCSAALSWPGALAAPAPPPWDQGTRGRTGCGKTRNTEEEGAVGKERKGARRRRGKSRTAVPHPRLIVRDWSTTK